MGNSVQKRKRKREEADKNFSAPSSSNSGKPKGTWLLGRPGKLRTAGPKANEDQKRLTVHYTTSRHHQENVFIEGSRPQYLEDLHTEAREGLKILQQEEHKNGLDFADGESLSSSDTLRPEQDVSSKDGGGSLESGSTTGNTDTTVTSSVSERAVLTRQGSTFKPLNPVKRLDKSRKRNRRTTIMGIPNQVQKELALHRSSTFQPLVSLQLPDPDGKVSDGQSGVVIIPTLDGGNLTANKEGARVHLSELEASRDEQLFRKHLEAIYQDKQHVNHHGFGSHLCPASTLRPKSLAVSGLTTSSSFCPSTMLSFLQEPQGPVMSISPQATYLSTIIPNAVLPSSIQVIEIDRSSNRTHGNSLNHGGSVCTMSKSSLATRDSSVSPSSSRRSDGDGSLNHSTQMPASTSGSNWSGSQSSKTIISKSSPASSKGSRHSGSSKKVGLNGQDGHQEYSAGDQDHVSLCSSVSGISSPNSEGENHFTTQESECGVSGSDTTSEDTKNKRNSARSLSVMKTKQPPAPPRRTNSLHGNKIRSSSRVQVNINGLYDSGSGEMDAAKANAVVRDGMKLVTGGISTGSSSLDVSFSPLSPVQASSKEPQSESRRPSPQKSPSEEGKFERTMSPSSGYSSQSGTPTLSPKVISPTSQEKQKKPVKPERSASRASSSAASPFSSLTSLSSSTPEPVNSDVSTVSPGLPPEGTSLKVTPNKLAPNNNCSTLKLDFRELLNIPPPPMVKAPSPPPPETWVHNRRTFELLCGPYLSVGEETPQSHMVQESTDKKAGTQTKARTEIAYVVDKKTTIVEPVFVMSESEEKLDSLSATDPGDVQRKLESSECPGTEEVQGSKEVNADVQREEQSSDPVAKNLKKQESPKRKDPPLPMIKPMAMLHKKEAASTEWSVERLQREVVDSTQKEVHLAENHPMSSQNGVTIVVETSDNEMDRSEVPVMQTEAPKVNKASPPHTPPPTYHPTPPPSKKTPPSSVTTPPDELHRVEEEIQVVDSCWPPPPPPLEGDSVFDGGDEVDFPPPPPPFLTDGVPDVTDSCVKKVDVHCTVATQEVLEANEDSNETGTSVQVQNSDWAAAIQQSSVCDNKPEVTMQLSKSVSTDEISFKPEQYVQSPSNSIPFPPVESPPSTQRAENPVSVSALVPSSSFQSSSGQDSAQTCIAVPVAPPLPAEGITHGVNFRRQPSGASRDTRSKELLSRHKSTPVPKEDANIPLVTPSLLQMVRLRSVHMSEDQMQAPSEDKSTNPGATVQESCPVSIPGPQNIPQKPVRKSLTLKSPLQTVKTSSVTLNAPSMRLQEAIRMKTEAMSSRDGLPSRLGVRSPTYTSISDPGTLPLRSPEGCDMHKSAASTASFIFSRSTMKVVVETAAASSSEAQAGLKQSLAAELTQVSDPTRAAALCNGGAKWDKVPPPVAKKPAHGSITHSLHHPASSGKTECSVEGGGGTEVQHTSGITPPDTTTRVTADTIETLF